MASPLAVTKRTSLPAALLLLAFLLSLLVIIFISVQSTADVYAPRSWYANYRDVPVGQIVEDLENRQIIPKGTMWESNAIKARRVTVRWIAASDRDALGELAKAARVKIAYPVGYHGDLWGPVSIQNATVGVAAPYMDRQSPYRGTTHPLD